MDLYLKQLFIHAARWSAYETIVFNLLLSIHTALLFIIMPQADYGILGVSLSCIYTVALLCTMGNDITTIRIVGPIATKYSLCSALLLHGLHALIIGFISIAVGFYSYYDLIANTHTTLFVISCLALVAEVSRKIVKALLLTLGDFDHVAHSEIASILLYMLLVWSLYGLGYILTPCMLIAVLCIISGSTSMLFATLLYHHYKKTTDGAWPHWHPITAIKLRSALCSIAHGLFSGNYIVPLTAACIGTIYAGSMKCASTLIQNGMSIAERIYCANSSLLFSHNSGVTRNILHLIHTSMMPILLLGSLGIYGLLCILMYLKQCTYIIPIIGIYIIMQLTSIISNIFERFLLAKEDTAIVYIQMSTILAALSCLYMRSALSYTSLLIVLTMIRMFFLCMIAYRTYSRSEIRVVTDE